MALEVECAQRTRELGDRRDYAFALQFQAAGLHLQGFTAEGLSAFGRWLALWPNSVTYSGSPPPSFTYMLLLVKFEPVLCIRLSAAYQDVCKLGGFTVPLIWAAQLDQGLTELRAALGAKVFDATWEQGRGLPVQQALAEAQAAAERLQAAARLDAERP